MSEVIVIGGGLAGLAATAALAGAGHQVRLLEARPFLGGRATSYEVGGAGGSLKGGRHLKYPSGTPMANLLLTLL